jgi:hypothetical protein
MSKRWFLAFLLALAAAFPALATSVLPVDLDQMVATASVAFEGTCTGNRTERDPATNMVVTYTTFAVHDVLKGNVGTTYEIKQIGGELPNGMRYKVEGVPRFDPGQDYVVFLAGVSAAGFSSPIGLAQGRFVVTPATAGREVSNGRDFRDLTSTIPAADLPPALQQQAKRGEPMQRLDLDQFKQLVRRRAGATK